MYTVKYETGAAARSKIYTGYSNLLFLCILYPVCILFHAAVPFWHENHMIANQKKNETFLYLLYKNIAAFPSKKCKKFPDC